jgi:hypothetical protein
LRSQGVPQLLSAFPLRVLCIWSEPHRLQQEPRDVNYGPMYSSDSNTVSWKENRHDWGLLNGYWKARP